MTFLALGGLESLAATLRVKRRGADSVFTFLGSGSSDSSETTVDDRRGVVRALLFIKGSSSSSSQISDIRDQSFPLFFPAAFFLNFPDNISDAQICVLNGRIRSWQCRRDIAGRISPELFFLLLYWFGKQG